MEFNLGEIATILETPCQSPDRRVTGYSIDSRTLKQGELFFALRGPRFDGHEFVQKAIERGAAGAVVERLIEKEWPAEVAPFLLAVPDTTKALQQLAKEVRRRWGKRMVAVTGSAGKTTTKELIASILAQRYSVLRSPGNLNNHYGLPLALLGLSPAHDVAVVELAMSAKGEIARLAKIAAPQVGVVTNVAPVHLEFFDSVDSIAKAKRELIENLAAPATAVLNYDDSRVRRFGESLKAGQILTFGFEEGATFRATQLEQERKAGTRFRVTGPAFEHEFRIPAPGRHNVQNALAAIVASSVFGVTPNDVESALATFPKLHQRSEIITLAGGITLLNESYNSNPRAMEVMLETLATWANAKRRIVVAGEMLELGATSPELHRQVGRKCAASDVDWLLAVQGAARFMVEGAVEAGLTAERARFYDDAESAAKYCAQLLKPGDVVLVKGSRGVHLEMVVQLLDQMGKEMTETRKEGPKTAEV